MGAGLVTVSAILPGASSAVVRARLWTHRRCFGSQPVGVAHELRHRIAPAPYRMPSLPGPALAITNAALTLFHGKAAFHHDSSDSYWRRRDRFRRGAAAAPVTATSRFPGFFVTSPPPCPNPPGRPART